MKLDIPSEIRSSAASNPTLNMAFDKSFQCIFYRFGAVLDIGVRFVQDALRQQLSREQLEQIITETERLYDVYVGPLDIPWVPNTVVEPIVDAKIRALIRPNLLAVADWVIADSTPTKAV